MPSRILSILLAVSLSLHVVVPQGFMPGNVQSGWFLEWCPEGVSEQAMHALFGHAHHHDAASDGSSFVQCDLSGLCADTHLQAQTLAVDDVGRPRSPRANILLRAKSDIRPAYHSRAPPAFL